MKNNNFEINGRPKVITVLCWVIIIYSLLDISASIMFLANYEKLIEQDYSMKEIFSPGAIFSLIIINIPIVIGAVGLFKMKKWGAWVFIGANVILALVRYSYGEQFQYDSGISPYIAFIVPGLCIGIVLYFYKYLSDSQYPELKPAPNSSTIKQDSSELLSKLEQLHSMKEEEKLTEEEYLMMKSKVMSALTGKVFGTKTETKRAEDQTLTNKSKNENTPDSLNQSGNKQSDDSGILGKLEQLHKMKEEGKLSDEEYNIMKNKVMSALTGKEIQSVTETKKVADETPINMQEKKENFTESQTLLKVTEDSGPAGKIQQLYQMKEKGMISEEEFNSMKSKILLSMIENKEPQKSDAEHKDKVESPLVTKAKEKDKVSSSSSQSYQSYDSKDKLQISKKVIYSGVALILLALGFVFVYPKFSQEEDPGINKLIGYFSNEDKKEESKTSLQNTNSKKKVIQKVVIDKLTAKDESVNNCGFSGGEYPKISGLNDEKFQEKLNGILRNNVEEFKRTIKGEVSEGWGDVNGYLDFEVLTNNDTLITIIQRTNWVVCGANGYGFDAYVLNADININRILTNDDMNIKSIELNKYNTIVYDFFKRQDLIYGNAKNPHSIMDYYPGNPDNFDYIPVVKSFEELNKYKFGYKNGKLVLIETAMPSSRASLSVYIIPMNFPSNTTSDETVASLSTEQVHGSDNASGLKENKTYGNASDIVKSWIESLGKRDFETAYNLMSPSLSKSYAIFTSLNRYGGITKTKVHSVESVSSSGCNYVVVASYDSFDPSNRDGKFTERFNVSNCNGNWQITNIKNINTEYYR